MRRLRLHASLSLLALAGYGFGQSPFQDARGESSLFLPGTGGFLQLNTKEGTGLVAYVRNLSTSRYFYGLQLNGKLTGDSASLFSDRDLAPDASLGFTLGYRFPARLVTFQDRFFKRYGYTAPRISDLDGEEQVKYFLGISPSATIPDEFYKEVLDRQKVGERYPQYGLDPNSNNYEKEFRERHHLKPEDPLPKELLRRQIDGAKLSQESQGFFDLSKVSTASDGRELALGQARWLTLDLTARQAQYRMYDPNKAVGSHVTKENFSGYGATLAYNQFFSNNLFGLSLGYKRDNNTDDLKPVDVLEQTTIGGIGGSTTVFQASTKAYRGRLDEVSRAPLNADMIFFQGDQFAIDLFGRYDLSDRKGPFVPGCSFFVTQKGSPLKVIGGLSFTYRDGSFQTALVAGFNF